MPPDRAPRGAGALDVLYIYVFKDIDILTTGLEAATREKVLHVIARLARVSSGRVQTECGSVALLLVPGLWVINFV